MHYGRTWVGSVTLVIASLAWAGPKDLPRKDPAARSAERRQHYRDLESGCR